MTLVVDASAIIALYNRGDPHHEEAVAVIGASDEDLMTSPMCLAETDYVLLQRGGRTALQQFWRTLQGGGVQVRWWADALGQTVEIAQRHEHLGLADASLVALADRLMTDRIFTFDRHFAGLRTPQGRTLTLVPQEDIPA